MKSLRTLRERFIDYMKDRECAAKTDYNPFWEYMARWLTDQDHDTWLLLNEHKKEVEHALFKRLRESFTDIVTLQRCSEIITGEEWWSEQEEILKGGTDHD